MNAKQTATPIGPPRFALAVHALVWLTQSGCVRSSAHIAEQVNSHATFLRRVLASLVQAGIVDAREGRDGGYSLSMTPEQITLADVYAAVKNECHENPVNHTECGERGRRLDAVLETIVQEAERKTVEHLRKYSIADVMKSAGGIQPLCDQWNGAQQE